MQNGTIPIGDLVEPRVEQTGPRGREFTYVDIGSVDRETKRIVHSKVLPTSKAPSRARQVLKAGDVLVSMTRPNLNAVALVPPDLDGAIGSTGFHVMRPREAEPGFLFYAVQSRDFINAMCQKVQGALYPAVRPRDISSFCLPNFSLGAQRATVAEIEKQFTRLEAGVSALRRAQANLKRYRAAVLKSACEGRLVPTEAELAKAENRKFETGEELLARILAERRKSWRGRGKYNEPADPEVAQPGVLPQGWTWTNLDAAIVSGPQNGVYLPRELYGKGSAILRIDDYQDGWVRDVDELNKVTADQVTVAKYQLLPGDLIINRVNSLTHLGKCLVVDEAHAGGLFESNMMKSHLAACVNPRFVEFYLRSRDGKARLVSGAKWAVNQASINQEDVKRTPLPLPPFAEQTRIVAEVERRLSVVDGSEAVMTANLRRSARLRQAILQEAFNGPQ